MPAKPDDRARQDNSAETLPQSTTGQVCDQAGRAPDYCGRLHLLHGRYLDMTHDDYDEDRLALSYGIESIL